MRPLLVFVDTSVFGGAFDPEFAEDTRLFFSRVRARQFKLAVSEQVGDEVARAPERVRKFYDERLPIMKVFKNTAEIRRLADIYVYNKIVGEKSFADATHVACATIRGCAGLVSWNFKHIVHPDKCMHFNLVNVSLGYPQLFIASPKEVVSYEKRQ